MSETLGDLMLALSASPALSLLTKATIGIVIGLVLLGATRRARASVRHAIAASIFAALLVLPLAAWMMPSIPIVVSASPAARPVQAVPVPAPTIAPAPGQPASSPIASAATPSAPWGVSWAALAGWVWALGAAVAAAPLLLSLRRLGQIRRRGLPWTDGARLARALAAPDGPARHGTNCGTGTADRKNAEKGTGPFSGDRKNSEKGTGPFFRRDIDVLLDETLAAPVTCGVASPAIVLPADAPAWDQPALRRALLHEIEHVRRGDWGVQVAARAVCALYWFHPLAWKAFRTLGLEAERACDDAVLVREESTQYAEQLVTLARRMTHDAAQPALAMARRSDLSARVSAILDAGQPRGRAGLIRSAAVALVAAAVVAGLAPLRATGAVMAPDDTVASDQSRRQGSASSRALDRALVESAQEGDLGGVRELLDAGGNVNATVDGDGSPLIVAAREGDLRMVTLLLDRGADPNLAVEGDGNPLIMAAREGHLRIVTLLLDRGAQIDAVVPGDENALIQASGEGRLDVVRLLLSRGADVNARVWAGGAYERRNGEWRTPLSMARRGGHRAVVEVLQAAGAVE